MPMVHTIALDLLLLFQYFPSYVLKLDEKGRRCGVRDCYCEET